ncbi:MAG: 50S ribosomal protein L7/L12 [Puniceicoccales bacterium]|jgi:large subunit ribosomal protein L7/L12|nr:50S ribosomal protein L7/L12 [Puniceicoccales bacterium]
MSEPTKEQVVEWLGSRSVLEIAALVKELEEKWEVSAAAPVAVAAVAAPAAEEVEEKTEFTVMLLSGGDTKINVIKEIRALTGLGLVEAKNVVEGAPRAVKEGIAKAEAEEMKKRLEAVGGKVELR